MEILAPAGNKENLISAINAGANAVYLGLTDFSARKGADNFSLDDLKFAINYAKTFNVKVYLTVNTLVKNSEIKSFIDTIIKAYSLGVDAFILQDIFLGKYLKSVIPNINLHLSSLIKLFTSFSSVHNQSKIVFGFFILFKYFSKIIK
jgi:putative protease